MTSPILSSAAAVCGLPDPAVMVQRLAALPVDQLATCGHYAGALAVALFQGSHLAQDAAAATRAAWSTGTAATAIGQAAIAAMAARSVLTTQSGALDGAGSVMRQLQTLAVAAVADAESALRQAGFDASTGRAANATATRLPYPLSSPAGTTIDGTAGLITPIVAAAHDRLLGLVSRLDTALYELALALRTDPRDMLQRLPALYSTSAPAAEFSSVPPTAAAAGARLATEAVAMTTAALGVAIGGALAGGPPDVSARRLNSIPDTAAGADSEARTRLRADRDSSDPITRARAENIEAALDQAASAGQTVQLLTYTPATAGTQGTAAIAIGDMSVADSVTTMVPGIQNSPDDMSGALADATRLRSEAHRRGPGESTAVVAWFGYDIPATNGYTPDRKANIGAAADDRAAVAGADALTSDLSRFREYAPETARQVVIGHSMGSVVVSAAAAKGLVIDDLILLGSPGASRLVESVGDFAGVREGHTYVMALDDPVTGPGVDNGSAAVDLSSKIGTLLTSGISGVPQIVADSITEDRLGPQFGPDPAAATFRAVVVDARAGQSDGRISTIGSFVAPLMGLMDPAVGYAFDQADSMGNHPQNVYLSGDALTAIADITVGHAASVATKPGR